MSLGAALFLALACGGSEGKELTLGSVKVSDHGTKDVSALSSLALEVDDYYFEPTFLRGKPGQALKVEIANESSTLHNFTIASLGIDKDISGKGKVAVDVSFPQSGVLLFVCKYHTGQGMNGELLVGDATPQPAGSAGSNPDYPTGY